MTTYITFVMDETGSMTSMRDEAISGFNKYLDTIKGIKGRVSFSLLKFDSYKLDWFVKDKSPKKVSDLTEDTYVPGAMTPLWDAVAHAIAETEQRTRRAKNPDVIVTVLTDGYENASREHTADDVKKLIEEHDDWAFNFVGAGIDAWDLAQDAGFQRGMTVSAQPGPAGLTASLNAAAIGTRIYTAAPAVQKAALRVDLYAGKLTAEEIVEDEEDSSE